MESAPPLTLGAKQRLFTRLVGVLIEYAYQEGYELTFGYTFRSKAEAAAFASEGKGITNSLHELKLAVDFNLFKNGKFLTLSEDHKPLGVFWESLHPLCRWGGRFTKLMPDGSILPKPDGNHYSLEHEGVK